MTPDILTSGYNQQYALVIGIDKYRDFPNLEHASNDAESIKSVLIDHFNYAPENITLLLNEDATKDAIMSAYMAFTQTASANDSVIFFFAGHGLTYPGNNGAKGFIVPVDGANGNAASFISYDSLVSNADLIKAKHIFFIMDACYSGLALLRSSGMVSKRFLADLTRRPVRQVLTAGKSDQPVKDAGGGDNSIFTKAVIDGLKGGAISPEGVLSASSLINYVREKVGCNPASRQTPSGGHIEGEGDFILNYDQILQAVGNSGEEINKIVVTDYAGENISKPDRRRIIISEIEEYISDSKSFIKLDQAINNMLREYHIKTKNINETSPTRYIKAYLECASDIVTSCILLAYYGDKRHNRQIDKILRQILSGGIGEDLNKMGNCFVAYVIFASTTIAAIESDNTDFLERTFKMQTRRKYHNDSGSVYAQITDVMARYYNDFGGFYLEIKYKYPLSEYLCHMIQPFLEDIIYLGDSYIDKFNDAELLLCLLNAARRYEEESRVWFLSGRSKIDYVEGYNLKVEDSSVFDLCERIGLMDNIKDKEDFLKQFNAFLAKRWVG